MKQHNKDKIVSRKSVFQKRYRVLDPLRNFPGGTIYMGLNRDDKSRVYLRVYHGITISSDEHFVNFLKMSFLSIGTIFRWLSEGFGNTKSKCRRYR